MKIKYLSILPVIAVVVLLDVSFAQASGSSYTFNQNLTIGSTGADVIALQEILINDGYLTSVSTPTGYFGYGTQVALGKFQAANGISPASGYCGSITRTFLNSLSTSSSQPTSAEEGQNSVQTNSTPPPTPSNANVCSGTPCNGACYNACPSGDDFVCPVSGEAYCQPNQQQQAANQKAADIANLEAWIQTYNNTITEDQNDAAKVQAEANQPCSAMMNTPLSEAGGEQGAIASENTAECSSYEEELTSIYQEEGQTEQAETSAKNELYYLESLPSGQ